MTEKAQLILAQLKFITPDNLSLKSTASASLRESFCSLWSKHSPSAARYMLLPYFYDDRVEFTS